MSLALYDQALHDKIKEVFDNVVNADESEAFYQAYKVDADTQEEYETPSIALPLISFWRVSNPPNLEADGNFVHMLKGKRHPHPIDEDAFRSYRSFPVIITYQISIWSDTRREVDEIYREFCMFFFVDEPFLTIRVEDETYKGKDGEDKKYIIDEQFSLQLIDSNTEIDTQSFSDRGRVYRQDIIIEIDNARMFYLGGGGRYVKSCTLSI